MENKKPKIFLILKIIASLMLVGGIVLIVLGTAVYPEMFNGHSVAPNPIFFIPGMIMLAFSMPCFIISFIPEINKMSIKTTKYLYEENKEDLKDIVDTKVNIASEGITSTSVAIKKGLRNTKFCRYCGKEIEADSKFCNECGKQQ